MENLNTAFFANVLALNIKDLKFTFYFSEQPSKTATKLHFSLWPNSIKESYPALTNNDFLYTTFTYAHEGFKQILIDFSNDNIDLLKQFLKHRLKSYFIKHTDFPFKSDFIGQLQVWVPNTNKQEPNCNNNEPQLEDTSDEPEADRADVEQCLSYSKFTLKVTNATVTKGLKLQVSFDGISTLYHSSVGDIIQQFGYDVIGSFISKGRVYHFDNNFKSKFPNVDLFEAFPVLNRDLSQKLNVSPDFEINSDPYNSYLSQIQDFISSYINTSDFQNYLPHYNELFKIPSYKISNVPNGTNLLRFATGTEINPFMGLIRKGVLEKSKTKAVFFYILPNTDKGRLAAKNMHLSFKEGLEIKGRKKMGIQQLIGLDYHFSKEMAITYNNIQNPVNDIREKLDAIKLDFSKSYFAIYITPYSRLETNHRLKKNYYLVKELLLQKGITSQAIFIDNPKIGADSWRYSLPNIAIAILAKLNGVPWQLNVKQTDELIVGVGAFKNYINNVKYIGSAFSFDNIGNFQEFDYYPSNDLRALAGSIKLAIHNYASLKNKPSRLIIHFYKTMSKKELEPITNALENLGLNIPVFIVTINKTESKDLVAFDPYWYKKMPLSGTFINIGQNRFLLFNNTRYSNNPIKDREGYPFPVKLRLQCNRPELLENARVKEELITQVYQFSRNYWKSVSQQNLPVTIKYPEMVAQIAPNFNSNAIPEFGRKSLWFL